MNDIIILAVQLGITVAAFVVGKYVFPNLPKNVTDKLTTLSQWAAKFVEWAKEFMKKQTGEEKMAAVVEKLKEIADEAGIEVTEDQLRAIAQSAYNAMKAGEKEAEDAAGGSTGDILQNRSEGSGEGFNGEYLHGTRSGGKNRSCDR